MIDHPGPSSGLRGGFIYHVRPLAVQAMLSVNSVELPAHDTPAAELRRFYAQTLGLSYAGPLEEGGLAFRHGQRSVHLLRDRDRAYYGRLAIAVRRFDKALESLRDARIAYELHHTDGGLSRWALLRDPSGNFVFLHETRPF